MKENKTKIGCRKTQKTVVIEVKKFLASSFAFGEVFKNIIYVQKS